jgi:hypothetical protein
MSKKKKNPNVLYEVTVDYSTEEIHEGQYIVARGKLKKFKRFLERCGYELDPEFGDVQIIELGEFVEISARTNVMADSIRL